MIQNNYIQYKPYKYALDDEYIKSLHKGKSFTFNFEPHNVSLESVIQKIENIDIPTTKEDWGIYCLDMVNKFGFLNINKYVKGSYGFCDYEKEPIVAWKSFAINLKSIIQNKDIDKIEVMNNYLKEDTYIYFDEFHTKNIAYKCNSLSSAIMLYMLTNKQHTKNCIKCNNLFFAKRNDAKYCNGSCARSYQRQKK